MVALINKRRLSGVNPSPLPLQLNDFIYKNQTVKLVTYPPPEQLRCSGGGGYVTPALPEELLF